MSKKIYFLLFTIIILFTSLYFFLDKERIHSLAEDELKKYNIELCGDFDLKIFPKVIIKIPSLKTIFLKDPLKKISLEVSLKEILFHYFFKKPISKVTILIEDLILYSLKLNLKSTCFIKEKINCSLEDKGSKIKINLLTDPSFESLQVKGSLAYESYLLKNLDLILSLKDQLHVKGSLGLNYLDFSSEKIFINLNEQLLLHVKSKKIKTPYGLLENFTGKISQKKEATQIHNISFSLEKGICESSGQVQNSVLSLKGSCKNLDLSKQLSVQESNLNSEWNITYHLNKKELSGKTSLFIKKILVETYDIDFFKNQIENLSMPTLDQILTLQKNLSQKKINALTGAINLNWSKNQGSFYNSSVNIGSLKNDFTGTIDFEKLNTHHTFTGFKNIDSLKFFVIGPFKDLKYSLDQQHLSKILLKKTFEATKDTLLKQIAPDKNQEEPIKVFNKVLDQILP